MAAGRRGSISTRRRRRSSAVPSRRSSAARRAARWRSSRRWWARGCRRGWCRSHSARTAGGGGRRFPACSTSRSRASKVAAARRRGSTTSSTSSRRAWPPRAPRARRSGIRASRWTTPGGTRTTPRSSGRVDRDVATKSCDIATVMPASPVPPTPAPPPSGSLDGESRAPVIDPAQAALVSADRRRRLNTLEIPALRLVGMILLALAVLLHNRYLLRTFSVAEWLHVTAILIGYAALAWLVLWGCWSRVRAVDLGLVFLVADLPVWAVAVYYTGGERSWLFVVVLIRVADQLNTSFARAVAFAHLAAVTYLALIGYLAVVEGRAIAWPAELSKTAFVYLGGLYVALAARVAEQRRRRMTAAVRVARDTIQQLGERTRELEEARLLAEEASRARSRFLALMSHELRTPLSSIIGFSRLLLRRREGELTEKQATYVQTVETNSARLLHLIDNVLDVARLDPERQRLVAEDVDVLRLVDECVTESLPLVGDKKVAIERDFPPALPALRADGAKLRQVLLNLLSNAIRFTPEGRVVVRVRDAAEGIHLAVADTGVGIAEAESGRVFEPFHRVEGAAPTASGAGLGLAISKMYVELHGGWIWAESRLHAGSTFHVTLPRVEPAR